MIEGAERTAAPGGRALAWALALSLLLLPFSTGHGRQVGGVAPGTEALIIPYALPTLLAAAALALAALARGARRVPFGLRYAVALAAVYAAVVTVFSTYSPSLAGFVYRATPTLIGFALFLHVLSVAGLPREAARREYVRLAGWVVASGAVLGAYYVVNFAVQTATHGIVPVLLSRTVGGLASLPWHASNVVAGVLLYPLVVCLALLQLRAPRRALLVLAALLMIGAVALTMSKGAIGCMLVLLVGHALILPGATPKLAMAGGAAAAIGVLALVMGEAFGTFVEVTTGTLGGDWSDGRLERVADSFTYFLRRPWLPLGYGDSGAVIDGGSHNIWMAHLVEMGLAGVLGLAGVIVHVAVAALLTAALARGSDRRTALLFLVGLAALLAHLAVETPLYTWQGTVYFWLLLGLMHVHREVAGGRLAQPRRHPVPVGGHHVVAS